MVADELGDRMKNYYENRSKTYLTRRTPIITSSGKKVQTNLVVCTKYVCNKLKT